MGIGKLLIVDDEQINRFVLKISAKKYGYECLEAANGLEALDVIKEDSSIKVILLDLNMPVMDGYGVLREVNLLYKDRDLHIYIVTASLKTVFEQNVSKASLQLDKVCGFFTKPVDMPSLFNDIKNLESGYTEGL